MAKSSKKDNDERKVSVLAYEKKITPSDGFLYGTTWATKEQEIEPLRIREKSVRGTISNSLKQTILDDPMKISNEITGANPQTVDCCFLKENDDTLVMKFTVKFLGNLEQPTACNNPEFLQRYQAIVREYIKEFGFEELAFRYIYNIAAARYLWRNRLGASQIETNIRDCSTNKSWSFNAFK